MCTSSGGALPIVLIGIYLVNGMYRILTDQAKNEEVTEIRMAARQMNEMAGTVSTVTEYFYFDPLLEEIATKQYKNYQEVVRDYREFTSFLDYGRYYNDTIAWINIYMKNDSIVGNSRFVQVTAEVEQEEWYRDAVKKNGGALWHFQPVPSAGYDALAFCRMLKTRVGENVGVLVVYIRPEQFIKILQNRKCDTFVVLNGKDVVADAGNSLKPEQIMAVLPEGKNGQIQENVVVDGQEYVMTSETVSLIESSDYLQVVSFRSYRDILHDVNSRTAKSVVFFAISAVLSISVILL